MGRRASAIGPSFGGDQFERLGLGREGHGDACPHLGELEGLGGPYAMELGVLALLDHAVALPRAVGLLARPGAVLVLDRLAVFSGGAVGPAQRGPARAVVAGLQ